MKTYVASSWRNELQPSIVELLRDSGHEVYDFRDPAAGQHGTCWREIAPGWENWTPSQYRDALKHPVARKTFESHMDALASCDACVLVLPSGRSASFEFGWAIGNGKLGAVVQFSQCEPELMYSGQPIFVNRTELEDWARWLAR